MGSVVVAADTADSSLAWRMTARYTQLQLGQLPQFRAHSGCLQNGHTGSCPGMLVSLLTCGGPTTPDAAHAGVVGRSWGPPGSAAINALGTRRPGRQEVHAIPPR